jgi:hypothetical protein
VEGSAITVDVIILITKSPTMVRVAIRNYRNDLNDIVLGATMAEDTYG